MYFEKQSEPWLPAEITVTPLHRAAAAVDSAGDRLDYLVGFTAGIHSLPYLADHALCGTAVLPGSFSIELGRFIHRRFFGNHSEILSNIVFDSPVFLSDREISFAILVRDHGHQRIEYTFYEASIDEVGDDPERRHFARLEIGREDAVLIHPRSDIPDDIASMCKLAQDAPSDSFYREIGDNGNSYGPEFRNLAAIAVKDGEACARLQVRRQHRHPDSCGVHPALLDSMTQSLSAVAFEAGKAFMLTSIERVEILEPNLPDELWTRARLRLHHQNAAKGYTGDVCVFDPSGTILAEFTGVAFTFLEREPRAATAPQTDMCIASTFSAEPLEDSIRFWSAYFGLSIRARFAPYNQVFQQLLDPASLLRKNRNGVNVVLIGIADWLDRSRPFTPRTRQAIDERFGADSRCQLPNGIEIAQWNRYETDYLYNEIFQNQSYLQNGIRLSDGDTVIDIGANIGLFSLFVLSRCQRPAIYAFEPASPLFERLQINLSPYGDRVHVFNLGVSDSVKISPFTFYENSSVFSGFYAEEHQDKNAVDTVVKNILRKEGHPDDEMLKRLVHDLTEKRLEKRHFECQMTSLSDIIRQNKIEKIHLLKIDAEKSELDIIQGIESPHWPIIDQIVVEVHNKTGHSLETLESILVAHGYRCTVVEDTLLKDTGLFNIYATRSSEEKSETPAPSMDGSLLERANEFCAALNSVAGHSTTPLIIAIAPGLAGACRDPEFDGALARVECHLKERTATMPSVNFIGSDSIFSAGEGLDYFDSHSHELGHMPYTHEGYAAIGTALFRAAFHSCIRPFKAIVLDCDNTLWRGSCAEDGPLGVAVTAPYRALQEFMVRQFKAGMLICICSKNREQDVIDVFEQRQDMVLRREHVTAWRINWERKSENIRSLANELRIGTDSFVFIDDNPVECAEVRANCPRVLVLQLPRSSDMIAAFLRSIWLFDRQAATREDSQRAAWYRDNRQRVSDHNQTLTLKDFLNSLELQIDVAEVTEDQLERVSQLTLRTNQFNFTSIRRNEGEIRGLLADGKFRCLTTHVRDRFGDYGLVGAVIYETAADQFRIDSFLLSCRALGKGVEHRMLSEVGQRAAREGRNTVQINFSPTERNRPALEFVRRIAGRAIEGNAPLSLALPAVMLASLKFDPEEVPSSTTIAGPSQQSRATKDSESKEFVEGLCEKMQRIGDELYDPGRISAAIGAFRLSTAPSPAPGLVLPGNATETALAEIWKKVLGRAPIGINDNFFDVGGNSLRAVQVIAATRRELGRSLSIVELFEYPTIKLSAAKLAEASHVPAGNPRASEAQSRGRQRRLSFTKRGPE